MLVYIREKQFIEILNAALTLASIWGNLKYVNCLIRVQTKGDLKSHVNTKGDLKSHVNTKGDLKSPESHENTKEDLENNVFK
jgi:hypothetical protein